MELPSKDKVCSLQPSFLIQKTLNFPQTVQFFLHLFIIHPVRRADIRLLPETFVWCFGQLLTQMKTLQKFLEIPEVLFKLPVKFRIILLPVISYRFAFFSSVTIGTA